MKKVNTNQFFKVKEPWEEEWEGMPEFKQEDLSPYKSILVHFANQEDMEAFAKLIKQHLTKKTKSIWYPKAEAEQLINLRYIDEP